MLSLDDVSPDIYVTTYNLFQRCFCIYPIHYICSYIQSFSVVLLLSTQYIIYVATQSFSAVLLLSIQYIIYVATYSHFQWCFCIYPIHYICSYIQSFSAVLLLSTQYITYVATYSLFQRCYCYLPNTLYMQLHTVIFSGATVIYPIHYICSYIQSFSAVLLLSTQYIIYVATYSHFQRCYCYLPNTLHMQLHTVFFSGATVIYPIHYICSYIQSFSAVLLLSTQYIIYVATYSLFQRCYCYLPNTLYMQLHTVFFSGATVIYPIHYICSYIQSFSAVLLLSTQYIIYVATYSLFQRCYCYLPNTLYMQLHTVFFSGATVIYPIHYICSYIQSFSAVLLLSTQYIIYVATYSLFQRCYCYLPNTLYMQLHTVFFSGATVIYPIHYICSYIQSFSAVLLLSTQYITYVATYSLFQWCYCYLPNTLYMQLHTVIFSGATVIYPIHYICSYIQSFSAVLLLSTQYITYVATYSLFQWCYCYLPNTLYMQLHTVIFSGATVIYPIHYICSYIQSFSVVLLLSTQYIIYVATYSLFQRCYCYLPNTLYMQLHSLFQWCYCYLPNTLHMQLHTVFFSGATVIYPIHYICSYIQSFSVVLLLSTQYIIYVATQSFSAVLLLSTQYITYVATYSLFQWCYCYLPNTLYMQLHTVFFSGATVIYPIHYICSYIVFFSGATVIYPIHYICSYIQSFSAVLLLSTQYIIYVATYSLFQRCYCYLPNTLYMQLHTVFFSGATVIYPIHYICSYIVFFSGATVIYPIHYICSYIQSFSVVLLLSTQYIIYVATYSLFQWCYCYLPNTLYMQLHSLFQRCYCYLPNTLHMQLHTVFFSGATVIYPIHYICSYIQSFSVVLLLSTQYIIYVATQSFSAVLLLSTQYIIYVATYSLFQRCYCYLPNTLYMQLHSLFQWCYCYLPNTLHMQLHTVFFSGATVIYPIHYICSYIQSFSVVLLLSTQYIIYVATQSFSAVLLLSTQYITYVATYSLFQWCYCYLPNTLYMQLHTVFFSGATVIYPIHYICSYIVFFSGATVIYPIHYICSYIQSFSAVLLLSTQYIIYVATYSLFQRCYCYLPNTLYMQLHTVFFSGATVIYPIHYICSYIQSFSAELLLSTQYIIYVATYSLFQRCYCYLPNTLYMQLHTVIFSGATVIYPIHYICSYIQSFSAVLLLSTQYITYVATYSLFQPSGVCIFLISNIAFEYLGTKSLVLSTKSTLATVSCNTANTSFTSFFCLPRALIITV